MQIIEGIEQGSAEWLELRRGIPTASEFNRLLTAKRGDVSSSLEDYAIELASQDITETVEERPVTMWMSRGKEEESFARRAYIAHTLSEVKEVSFVRLDNCGCSPDGLVDDDGLIEIKTKNQLDHFKIILSNEMPIEHKAQVQGQLYITRREWCDFCSWNPTFKPEYKLHIIRVFRDEEYINKLKNAIEVVNAKKMEILNKLK